MPGSRERETILAGTPLTAETDWRIGGEKLPARSKAQRNLLKIR